MLNIIKALKYWLLSALLFGLSILSGFVLDNYFSDDTVFKMIIPFLLFFLTASVWLIIVMYHLVMIYAVRKAMKLRAKFLRLKK
ncbi:hypothetical protein HY463_00460 [Candidatus Peregrinibacteria bacterium]|nr:hypothetical protein [Candidatus Peregrinibacteria bacterium]